ncbi:MULTISPECIES: hypothetical protein [Gardnerella]|uniref:hypothetical protein n=1 Tax=Gardnerella TaxID=2701 RepID=UPI0013C2D9DF|nr:MULTISPECIES: hypothetical protein [Gardnerella]MDK7092687.1 hypothetical protein [Gardnerella swidsinskii]MDK8691253.1 hypothetical protein [Gardnerella swidsinskii]NSX39842.1 hypothetical protein [Gardnerella vaginalis]NSX40389.1 hypothetical protein [Gardnerella vaginalis]UQA88148.1 hypothetical protein K9E37_03820 [Gardnerella swidsinskii]
MASIKTLNSARHLVEEYADLLVYLFWHAGLCVVGVFPPVDAAFNPFAPDEGGRHSSLCKNNRRSDTVIVLLDSVFVELACVVDSCGCRVFDSWKTVEISTLTRGKGCVFSTHEYEPLRVKD